MISMIKFNSDRDERYQIRTDIFLEDGKKIVRKVPETSAAEEHIKEIFHNQEILLKSYPNCDICPASLNGKELKFEFIDGISLGKRYRQIMLTNDKKAFWNLVDIQVDLIKGKQENEGVFSPSVEYEKIFGNGEIFQGDLALCNVNFEATPNNIIFRNETNKPVFIDYEWVFPFLIPLNLILYHCIVMPLTFFRSDFKGFVTRDELMTYLNIEKREAVEKAWRHFIGILDGTPGLAEIKQSNYLKSILNIKDLEEENSRLRGAEEYSKLLEKNVKEQQTSIEELSKGLEAQNGYVNVLEQGKKEQQEYIKVLEQGNREQQRYIKALEQGKEEQQKYIGILEQEKETQQKRIERLESVEQENKINKDKIERQKELISRQQDKLLEQARYINRVKSSLIGKLLFKN